MRTSPQLIVPEWQLNSLESKSMQVHPGEDKPRQGALGLALASLYRGYTNFLAPNFKPMRQVEN